jgi:hypothetical protein
MEKVPVTLFNSLLAAVPSQLKLYLAHSLKNRLLAERLLPFYSFVCEQLIVQFASHNQDSSTGLQEVHHLLLLLKNKVFQAFQTGVIRACLD